MSVLYLDPRSRDLRCVARSPRRCVQYAGWGPRRVRCLDAGPRGTGRLLQQCVAVGSSAVLRTVCPPSPLVGCHAEYDLDVLISNRDSTLLVVALLAVTVGLFYVLLSAHRRHKTP